MVHTNRADAMKIRVTSYRACQSHQTRQTCRQIPVIAFHEQIAASIKTTLITETVWTKCALGKYSPQFVINIQGKRQKNILEIVQLNWSRALVNHTQASIAVPHTKLTPATSCCKHRFLPFRNLPSNRKTQQHKVNRFRYVFQLLSNKLHLC